MLWLYNSIDFHAICLSQEEKGEEIKQLRQSSNFKPMPMPGFYRAQKASKSPIDKVCPVPDFCSTLIKYKLHWIIYMEWKTIWNIVHYLEVYGQVFALPFIFWFFSLNVRKTSLFSHYNSVRCGNEIGKLLVNYHWCASIDKSQN